MADSDVDVNTDNLDDFSATFFGTKPEVVDEPEISETPSATPEPETVEVEESTPEGEIGEDAPADEEAEDEEDEPEEAPKPRGRKPARERINELTRQRRELERELEASRLELEKLKSKPPEDVPVRQTKTAPLDADAPSPDATLEDGSLKYPLGEFDPSYISDLTRFTIRQENEAFKKQQEEDQRLRETQTAEKELLDSWTDKVKSASERLPDLAEKVTELEDSFTSIDPNYGQFLAATIMSLEYGPDVLNYLADHPDEAKSIVDSGPTKATVALGRLEARFIAGEEVEKGKIIQTQAPPPPPRTKGSGSKTGVAADTDDLDAFEKTFFASTKR